MTQPNQGIDMSRSGWTNPEGFQPTPRPSTPAPPQADVCGDEGPDGWTCDRAPHADFDHWADTGEREGLRWSRSSVETTALAERARGERNYLPGPATITDSPAPEFNAKPAALVEVGRVVEAALEESNPGKWYAALVKVQKVCGG